DLSFKFIRKFLHTTQRRSYKCVSERTNGVTTDLFTQLFNQCQIFNPTVAICYSIKNLLDPVTPFATWGTLTTRFMSIKVGKIASHINHIYAFVHDDKATRSEHRPSLTQRLVIHVYPC